MLGGLISDEVQENVNKVPLLGDLPLIGALFRTTTDTLVKKNLMVFIPPVIIDSDKVAENVTRNNYSLMQELQEKYNSGRKCIIHPRFCSKDILQVARKGQKAIC